MKRIGLAVLVLAAGWVSDAPAQRRSRAVRSAPPARVSQPASSLSPTADRLRHLHAKLGEPRPGEWLAQQKEAGQTFEQYLKIRPAELGRSRRTIYLAMLGDASDEQTQILRQAAEFLEVFYGLSVRWLDAIDADVVPAAARRSNPQTGQLQFDSIYILREVLPARVPADAAALLALTAVDLWPGNDWNFVFGQGSLGQPTGVWSIYRFGDAAIEAERPKLLERTIKVATHETGHLFGMPHCTAYHCGMNGSNSLAETDRHVLWFCPECEAKIWLVGGADPVERYRKLADLARRHNMPAELKLWQASTAALVAPR